MPPVRRDLKLLCWASLAKITSIERRLARFIGNSRVVVPPGQTRADVEALWADRAQARLSLVWPSLGLARRDLGYLRQPGVGP